jgi:prepilin-type N-terminal cleavage/methylation domain-containing protein
MVVLLQAHLILCVCSIYFDLKKIPSNLLWDFLLVEILWYNMYMLRKGFGLIEILVVIAIIGILGAFQVVRLNRARQLARVAAAEKALSGLISAAVLCQDAQADLLDGTGVACDGTRVWQEEDPLCAGSDSEWPRVPMGVDEGTCDSDQGTNTFSFTAITDIATVTCTQDGCTKTDI